MLNETNDDASLASSQTAGSAQGRWILNEEEYDNYFKTSDVRKTTMPNGWNKNIYCKICPANKDKAHYMRVAVRKCSSNLCNSAQVETRCPVNYRIEHCELAGYCITKRGNEHQALLENLSLADRPYGMAEYYKDQGRFFDTLLTLCQLLSIAYNPPFLMMDASVATFKSYRPLSFSCATFMYSRM